MEAIIFFVAVLGAAYVAFKITKFVISGCLKLVFLGALAALVAGAAWYLFRH